MPNSVLEALAVGLPLVLSDIDPHSELIRTNPAAQARFFPSGDSQSLREQLRLAAENVLVARGKGAPVHPRLSDSYNVKKIMEQYVRLYAALVSTP